MPAKADQPEDPSASPNGPDDQGVHTDDNVGRRQGGDQSGHEDGAPEPTAQASWKQGGRMYEAHAQARARKAVGHVQRETLDAAAATNVEGDDQDGPGQEL